MSDKIKSLLSFLSDYTFDFKPKRLKLREPERSVRKTKERFIKPNTEKIQKTKSTNPRPKHPTRERGYKILNDWR